MFDSGFGGLTVLKEILSRLPKVNAFFVADNHAFPYGFKQNHELIDRVEAVIRVALETIKPEIVVIACNTASTVCLNQLRLQFPCTFVGVVPAIKPAALQSENKRIGILATPVTSTSAYLTNLINEFANDCQVETYGSSKLVEIAEEKIKNCSVDKPLLLTELKELLALFEDELPDKIVLACTHFPLLKEEISEMITPRITLIDSGEAIARRVKQLLTETSANFEQKETAPYDGVTLYFTKQQNLTSASKTQIESYLSTIIEISTLAVNFN